jgi:hypothetical protein
MNSKLLLKHWLLIFIPTAIYVLLNQIHLFSIELFLSNFAAGANLFIFTISVLIMQIGRANKPEEFVFRYLTMTTVQMLSFLAIVTAFVFTKKPNVVVFHSLALFGVLLVFQSIGLLLFKTSNKEIKK